MIVCAAKNNFTIHWAILNFYIGKLYYRNKVGAPDGPYGRHVLEGIFLTNYENIIKYCKFSMIDIPGKYHKENDSYDGALGLVQQSKVDSFLRASDYNLEDKFYFTNCISGTQHFALQIIDENKKDDDDGLSTLLEFLIPSYEFTGLLIVSLIVYYGFLFFALRTNLTSKFVVKFLSFLFVIFVFYIDNFMNGNLNTSNVIVDTSDLLVNLENVLGTKKEFCLNMFNQPENDFFIKATKGTIQSQIYEKVDKKNTCYAIIDGQVGNIVKKDISNVFLLMYDMGANRLTRAVRTFFKKNVFTSTEPIFQNLNAYVMPKDISKRKRKIINTYVNTLFEFGYIGKFFKDIPNFTGVQEIKDSDYRHYTNVQDYIDGNFFYKFKFTIDLIFLLLYDL